MILLWIFVFCILSLTESQNITGYSCANKNGKVKSLNILQAKGCENYRRNITTTPEYVQLIELKQQTNIEAIQCQVNIEYDIYECTGFFFTEASIREKSSFSSPISRSKCEEIIHEKRYRDNFDHNIDIQIVNGKGKFEGTIIGDSSGKVKNCMGGPVLARFSRNSYQNAIVMAKISVHAIKTTGMLNIRTKKIRFSNAIEADFNLGKMVYEGIYFFWDHATYLNPCDISHFSVLYEGDAEKITEFSGHRQTISFAVNDTQTSQSFLLESKKEELVCYDKTYTTASKDIIIRTGRPGAFSLKKTDKFKLEDISLEHYHSIKLLSINYNTMNNIQKLYSHFKYEQCMTNYNLFQTIIEMTEIRPMHVGRSLLNQHGILATQAGESLMMIKCQEIECQVRVTKECYSSLPVKCNNKDYFLSPKDHLLVEVGVKVPCSDIIPVKFKVNNQWITVRDGKIIETETPSDLEYDSSEALEFDINEGYSINGIYSKQQIMQLEDVIMQSTKVQAMTTNFINTVASAEHQAGSFDVTNLVNVQKLKTSILGEYLNKVTSKMDALGRYFSVAIGLFIVLKLIFFVLNKISNFFAIFYMFGFSFRLLLCFIDPIVQWLINVQNIRAQRGVRLGNSRNTANPETGTLMDVAIAMEKGVTKHETAKDLNYGRISSSKFTSRNTAEVIV